MFFFRKRLALSALLIVAGGLSACQDPPSSSSRNDESGLNQPGGGIGISEPGVNRGNLPGAGGPSDHGWLSAVGDRVFFDVDKSTVRNEGRDVLVKWAAYLKQNPTDRLVIEGHSDERGTREYNLALGDRRASAVRDILVLNGVSASRITTVSYGKERPAVVGSDDVSYAQNRRAVGVLM